MTFRFRHTISVAEGVRLVKGQRVINLSDLTRAQAWSEHDQHIQAPLTLPTSGIHYSTRFDNTRAHQQRAQQLRERQKWNSKVYELSVTLTKGQEVLASAVRAASNAKGELLLTIDEHTPLNEADISVFWKELPQFMRCVLEEQAEKLNGVLAEYSSLHQEIPPAKPAMPVYTPVEFSELQPKRPSPLSLPPEPPSPQPPTIRVWHRILPGRQQQMARAYQNALHEWHTAKLRWKAETHQAKSTSDRARQRFKAYSSVWKARKLAHDAEQNVYAEEFATLLLNDESVMIEVLHAELNQLDWPCKTNINFQLNLDQGAAWLDVELPPYEMVSFVDATVSLQTQSLVIVDKSEEQRLKEYAQHVFSSVARLVGVVLGALPAMEEVVISAYTHRKEQDSNFDQDDYLISVRVSREAYVELGSTRLAGDPKSLLTSFNCIVSLDALQFCTITPHEPDAINR